ncbi:MAG: hypothetical protein GC168_18835 [Candidatus Hydrogenedens sp.]|nr:hypothetical protein [Candidatus Hydrogenedens sp.]
MMVVKARQVYKFAKEAWFPELKPSGFAEKNGEYHRILDSGVVHLIGIGKDPHGGETFRVMCGVDALPLKEELGGFGYMKYDGFMHLTPSGWDLNSGRWPCKTEAETRASVEVLLPLICELAIPYFAPIATLSDVANEINEKRMPHLLWLKARLLMLDRNIPGALNTIEKYQEFVTTPRPWMSKKHVQGEIDRAEQIRAEIEGVAQVMSESKR